MRQAAATAQRTGREVAQSMRSMGASVGQFRAGAQQLSFQIGDIAQQFALGQRPMMIFAQQSGQVIQAITMMRGTAGGFIGFMSGPWGAVLTGGVIILSTFVSKLFESRDALQRNIAELAENARKADLTRQAHEAYGRTLPGVIQNIREQTERLREQNRTLTENQQLQLQAARGNVARLEAEVNANVRAQAAAMRDVEDLERQIREFSGGDLRQRESMQRLLERRRADLARLLRENANLHSQIIAGNDAIREAQIPIIQGETEASLDGVTAATRRYESALADLNEQFRLNFITEAEYRRRSRELQAQRDRETAAAREAQRTQRDLVRPVTGSVLSQFGADRSGVPLNGRRVPGRRHEGVDLRGDLGDPVVAPEGGMAYRRNAPGGLGLYVEIRADSGARHLLGHLSGANVPEAGQRVTAGQLVGLVGNSGNARGGPTHLHWQEMVNGQWVDPMRRVGSSGAAQAAQQEADRIAREAEQRARNDAAFADELAQLDQALLDARQQGNVSAEERFALEQQELEAARVRRNASYEEAERRGQLTQAQREALTLKNDEVSLQLRINGQLEEWQRLDEQRLQIASEDLRDQESIEQARGQLARTVRERRDSELRLLDIAFREQMLAIERARLQEGLNDEMRARLDREEATARERYDLTMQSIFNRNRSPLEELISGAPRGAEELNEAFESVAAGGLSSLNDGLAEAIAGTRDLGDVFKQVAQQIIADLLRIQIQRAIIVPLANALGGLFGMGGSLSAIAGAAGAGAGMGGFGAALPKLAKGGTIVVGGFSGVDRNVLSLNGQPMAMVSRGEAINVGNGRGDIVIHQHVRFEGVAITQEEFMSGLAIMKQDTLGAIRNERRRAG